MSEHNQEGRVEARSDPSFWKQYEGKPVMVQLRPGLMAIGVTYPNIPLQIDDPSTGERQTASTGILMGYLHIGEDKNGVRLIVKTPDPLPQKRAEGCVVDMIFHPDDAAFVNVCDQRLISQTGGQ